MIGNYEEKRRLRKVNAAQDAMEKMRALIAAHKAKAGATAVP